MKQAIKRDIYRAVGSAAGLLAEAGFRSRRQGYWVCPKDDLRWELEVLFEPAYGDGVFRIGWAVRADIANRFVEFQVNDGVEHGTIGGDVGSLARGKSRMCLLAVTGAEPSLTARLLWGVRIQSVESLSAELSHWFAHLLAFLQPIDSYPSLVDFLDSYHRSRRKPLFDLPDAASPMMAVLRGLSGDLDGGLRMLNDWVPPAKPGTDAYRSDLAYRDRVAKRLREYSGAS